MNTSEFKRFRITREIYREMYRRYRIDKSYDRVMEEWKLTWRQVGKIFPTRSAMLPETDLESTKALRYCYMELRGRVPKKVLKKVIDFHRGRPRVWVAQPSDDWATGFSGLHKGHRLCTNQDPGWRGCPFKMKGIMKVWGWWKVDWGKGKTQSFRCAIWFLPQNKDVGETVWSISNRKRTKKWHHLLNGLAFGYPVDQVWEWTKLRPK